MKWNSFKRPGIAGTVTDREIGLITPEVLHAVDLIEVRVDLLSDRSDENLVKLLEELSQKGKPLIVTVRSVEEGSPVNLDDAERLKLYEAASFHATVLDTEIHADIFHEVYVIARDKNRLLIGSYHNFDITPPEDDLIRIVERGYSYGANIVKVATRINRPEDMRTLAGLCVRFSLNGIVVVGMGEGALPSRVFFPMIGSLFSFGSIGEPKAPG
ncbi:MAG: type I 3-dehydroquinate dehydratase, partial [Nitrospirae bacterium]